jgi:N-methylhydantoinase A
MNFHEQSPKIRVGVDVGGTFTKAVALRLDPLQIVAQAITPTTHADPSGVARGIVQVLSQILADPAVQGGQILAVSHSTTQAVNALLEGDTATVGIIGIGPKHEAGRLRRRVSPGMIALAPKRGLRTITEWLHAPITPERAADAIQRLIGKGAQAIVASGMYSVDDPAQEQIVIAAAEAAGLPVIGGHQVSSSYGLEIRTITAAVNASIIPKMVQTATQVEACLRDAGIAAPLLIMRGDGGLSDAATLRTRPILSLLSGPAASVAGALLFARVLDGIFIEVGGTSTNLAVIRDGQPILRYVQIMDRPTAIRSLDVRVQGVAGGSMARIDERRILDIGPRSAHIAGLPYLCYSQPRGEHLFAPTPGDPADYVCVQDEDGARYALTVTCAAAVLGLIPEGAYAGKSANREAALQGFQAFGIALALTPEKAAEAFLRQAADRIVTAARRLAREYRMNSAQLTLIGGGGGGGALVPMVARLLNVPYQLTDHAEVISSIGVALALVREEAERATDDIDALTHEVRARAIQSGAAPETVQVITETIPERGTLRAIATGALALDGNDPTSRRLPASELQQIVAQRVNTPPDQVRLIAEVGDFAVFQVDSGRFAALRGKWAGVVVIGRGGVVRLRAQGGSILQGEPSELVAALRPDAQYIVVEQSRLLRLDHQSAKGAVMQAAAPFVLIAEPEAIL